MFNHIQETHSGVCNRQNPGADWKTTLCETFRKPLERQVSEFLGIRRAKTFGQGRVGREIREVNNEVFNTKEEWYSHTSQWDVVG